MQSNRYDLKRTVRSLILAVVFFAALPLFGQTARLQLIHNSGDIDAGSLEVLVNGDSTTTLAFREATPFTDYAPGTYNFQFVADFVTEQDTIGPFLIALDSGVSYVGIIGGVTPRNLLAGKYDNPVTGRDISLSLFAVANAQEQATDPTKVDFFVFHGSTDSPVLDLLIDGQPGVLVDDIDYGQATSYRSMAPAVYTFNITPGDDNTQLLGAFEADLSADAGKSVVLFASGFLDPTKNEGAPKLSLLGAYADGTVTEFTDVTPGTPGPWKFIGAPDYVFDDFVGADTLVSAGHGVAVDKFNRIWVGNFSGALRVIHPDGTEDPISPIDSIKVGDVAITTAGCRGLAIASDGNILFARSAGDFAKINVETGQGMAYWKGGGSLLKPAVDAAGFIYVGKVVGINPVTVLDPSTFLPTQEITLNGAPSFGRGLEVTADGATIFTPDLGASGGPVYIWHTTDFINYVKVDSIFHNTEGKLIFQTQRTTMDWGPDSTLWVSSDNAYAAGNNDPNGFVILNFKTMEYQFLPSPDIGPDIGNGPRGVAFSVTGDTAYAVYFNGNRLARFIKSPTSVSSRSGAVPTDYVLEQNYPNPFNPSTTIAFSMAKQGKVSLKVYNLLGQEVATILDKKPMQEGRHQVTFDASKLASGVYYYKLSVNGKVLSRKMTLLK